jgi:tryptophan synthase alpha chain
LRNPVLVGFGIKDKASFDAACAQSNGAIIGTAFIRSLQESSSDIPSTVQVFLQEVLQ